MTAQARVAADSLKIGWMRELDYGAIQNLQAGLFQDARSYRWRERFSRPSFKNCDQVIPVSPVDGLQ